MHEIVTIQLGTQSNYLATHFWNAQESYFTYPPDPPSVIDHNVLFRPGVTRTGTETFTPRALVYDFKEKFGALGTTSGLYEEGSARGEQEDGGIWSSGVTKTIKQPPISPASYHESLSTGVGLARPLTTSSIRSFTDYLTPFYHPRSLRPVLVLSLSQSTLAQPISSATTTSHSQPPNSPASSFQQWQAGEELFSTLNADQELLDSDLRFWIEECDSLQGVQLFVDAETAWGGFAKGWMDGLRDELGAKSSVWVWAVGDSQSGDEATIGPEIREKRRTTRLRNSTYSMFELSPLSSMYIPISPGPSAKNTPSYLNLERASAWHTAAVQCAALETSTVSARLGRTTNESERGLLRDMEEAVNRGGERKIMGLSLSIEGVGGKTTTNGHSSNGKQTHGEDEEDALPKLDMDLYPSLSTTDKNNGRQQVFGRVEVQRGYNDLGLDDEKEEALERKFRSRYGGPIVESYSTPLPLPLLETYPRIFNSSTPSLKSSKAHTALESSSRIASNIRTLEQSVRRLVSLEDREAISSGLKGMADEYVEGFDDDFSDSGDEDW